MPGNKIGGLKARDTNLKRHGKDYYGRIGTIGGLSPYKGKKGFAANPELARTVGAIGGRKSSRRGVSNKETYEQPQ